MSKCLLCGSQLNSSLSLDFLMNFKPYQQPVICKKCQRQFKRILSHHCCKDCCRAGNFKGKLCQDCRRWRRLTGKRFQNYSLYLYNSMMSEYMRRYKFMGDYRLRHVFQNQFSRFVEDQKRMIVPIPIHRGTYQQRGFNQVKGLLKQIPITDCLTTMSVQKSVPQSHKSRTDRLQLRQPFQFVSRYRDDIKGKDVAIVDDVYTTGDRKSVV